MQDINDFLPEPSKQQAISAQKLFTFDESVYQLAYETDSLDDNIDCTPKAVLIPLDDSVDHDEIINQLLSENTPMLSSDYIKDLFDKTKSEKTHASTLNENEGEFRNISFNRIIALHEVSFSEDDEFNEKYELLKILSLGSFTLSVSEFINSDQTIETGFTLNVNFLYTPQKLRCNKYASLLGAAIGRLMYDIVDDYAERNSTKPITISIDIESQTIENPYSTEIMQRLYDSFNNFYIFIPDGIYSEDDAVKIEFTTPVLNLDA